jgi:hypothetical protein
LNTAPMLFNPRNPATRGAQVIDFAVVLRSRR